MKIHKCESLLNFLVLSNLNVQNAFSIPMKTCYIKFYLFSWHSSSFLLNFFPFHFSYSFSLFFLLLAFPFRACLRVCTFINWANEFWAKEYEKRSTTKDYFYCSPFVQIVWLFSLFEKLRKKWKKKYNHWFDR